MSDGERDPYDAAVAVDDAYLRRQRQSRNRGIKWIHPISRRPTDAQAALAAIPPDTRSLTQRLMNDPIPGDLRRRQ